MTRIRRLGALLLAAPLAMSVPITGVVLPADAAAYGITSPGNGSVVTSSRFSVSAAIEWGTWRLVVVSPSGSTDIVASKNLPLGSSGRLSGSTTVGANGRYRVLLQNHTIGWQDRDRSDVRVRIPPRSPSGVSASVSGSTLTVRWNLGLEDDLTSYSVKASGVGSKSGSKGGFCSGTSCSTTFKLSSGDTGSSTVSVRASRSNGEGGSVSSGYSSDSVNLPGSGGSGRGGGGGGGNTNGTIPPPNYGSNTQTPLTPFNDNSPVTLPTVQPDGATPGFAYQTPQVAGRPNVRNVSATESLQWGKSVAIAMVLLIIAAHLGAWTRRLRVAQAGVSAKGMAARVARSGTGRTRVKRMQEHIARAEASAKTATLRKPGSAGKSAGKGKKATRFGGLVAAEPKKGNAKKGSPPAGPKQPGPVQVNTARPGTPPQGPPRERVAGYEIISSDSLDGPEASRGGKAPEASEQPDNKGRHAPRRGRRRSK